MTATQSQMTMLLSRQTFESLSFTVPTNPVTATATAALLSSHSQMSWYHSTVSTRMEFRISFLTASSIMLVNRDMSKRFRSRSYP